jgi:hypothetical protein
MRLTLTLSPAERDALVELVTARREKLRRWLAIPSDKERGDLTGLTDHEMRRERAELELTLLALELAEYREDAN